MLRKSEDAGRWLAKAHGVRPTAGHTRYSAGGNADAYRDGKSDGARHGMSAKRRPKLTAGPRRLTS